MPKASGPVTTASSLADAPRKLTASLAPWNSLEMKLAERAGILVKDWGKQTNPPAYDNWSSGKSAPMCEAGQQIASLFKGAANPDKILCYVGVMDAANLFTNNNYDGNDKFYGVTLPPSMGGGVIRVKFKIEMSGGAISNFTMFTCAPGNTSSNNEFISSVLSGTSATMTTVRTESGSGYSYKDKLVVTGTFDSTGKWLSKQVDSKNYYTFGSSYTGANVNTMIQYADRVSLEGGYKSSTSSGNSFDTQHYVEMGLAGADKFSTLALGAGSGKMNFQNTWLDSNNDPQSYTSDSQVRSWDDAGAREASSPYLSAVQAKSVSGASIHPPTVSSQADFSSGQQWDCQAPAPQVFIPVTLVNSATTAGIAACEENFGDDGSSSNWIPCGYATSSAGGNEGYDPVVRINP
ncbi:MAG: hypothetical protein ACKN9V_09265 [Pseudomonadota bacterium]